MHIWLVGFLIALAASAGYGYWLGGYAKRHGWSEDYVRRRAALAPYSAGAMAMLALAALRIKTGTGWTAEGSPAQGLFWVLLGFLLGGGITTIIVLRRARSK
jgi:hypothetical protein